MSEVGASGEGCALGKTSVARGSAGRSGQGGASGAEGARWGSSRREGAPVRRCLEGFRWVVCTDALSKIAGLLSRVQRSAGTDLSCLRLAESECLMTSERRIWLVGSNGGSVARKAVDNVLVSGQNAR